MKISNILIFILTILIASCAGTKVGLEKHTGFTELPFPSNNFKPGQIVEIYSKPRKVEITHQADIPWDQLSSSEGWNISSTETNNIKATLSTEIIKILKGKYEYASNETVQVNFTNTRTNVIQKSDIYSAVKKALKSTPDLKEQINDFMSEGTHFDVITTTLSANVSFTLIDSTKNAVDVDSEVIKKINSSFNIDFSNDSGSKQVITGSNLVIGIHTDPKMVNIIMKKI